MVDPEDPTSLVGRRLGHYLVGPELGSGSMGQVHRARDLFDDRPVALKLHRSRAETQALRRFVQEARALGAIEHAGVAAVYDAGRDRDLLWIAMELVEGRSLSSVLEPGALPWPEALTLLLPVVEAVASAHAAGVMHRDIKPANVIVGSDGTAKLVDFGLAKRIGEIPQAAEGGETVWDWADVRTAPGAVLGTPAYMSPEQARAQPVDARSDVFALGVVLWEAIVGRPLFRRATAAATIRAILTEAAPRLDELDRAPRPLAAIVAHALENDPARRYADARALAAALRPLVSALPPAAVERTDSGLVGDATTVGAPPLLGRAREQKALGLALARRVREVAVVGGPAIGKTRLVEAALATLGDVRVVRVVGAEVPEPHVLEGARVVIALRPLGTLEPLRAALDAAAPRATIVRVGPRWVAQGVEHVVEVGPLEEDVAELAFPGVEEALGRALVRAVGGHPLGVTALATARARGATIASLASALEAPDAWPPVLAPIAARFDASMEHALAALDTLRALALLPRFDVPLAASLLDTSEPEAALVLSRLEAWSLLERAPSSDPALAGWWAPPPLVRRRLEATRPRDGLLDVVLTRTLELLASRAEGLALALDERPSESEALGGALRALDPLACAGAAHALALGAPALLDASARTIAAIARARRSPESRSFLAPVLSVGARVGASAVALLRGHAVLRTLASARHASALGRQAGDARACLEAALALTSAAAAAGESAEAERAADEALRLAEGLGLPGALTRASLAAADVAWARSEAPQARRAFERASSLAAQALDEGGGALAELGCAQLALAMGDDEGALGSLERAELHALASGRARIAAHARATVAELALRRGEIDAAREDVSLAAAHARALPTRLGRVALVAAEIELALGRGARAGELARASRRWMDEADGVGRAVALAIESVALAATSPAQARTLGVEALSAARALGRVEAATVAAWLGSAPGAEAATALDVLSLPPRATTFAGTSLALASRAVELGLSSRRSRWPEPR